MKETNNMDRKTIAFIGTGVMGAPMALHLAKAGHKVKVYNRSFSKAEALEPHCQACSSIASCVAEADFVFSIVGFPKDVEETYLGEDGIVKNAKQGAFLVDMTTSDPELAKRIGREALAFGKNLHVLDAPVTGGDKAREATLSIMVGGDEEDFKIILPLLECMGTTITYMGPLGSGQHAKLANQISIAGCLIGCAESLTYARANGLDPEAMLKVIKGGSASSWQAVNNGPKMLANDYAPGFFVKHLYKDLKLGLNNVDGREMPILEKSVSIFARLLEQGLENNGTQAVIEFYNENSK